MDSVISLQMRRVHTTSSLMKSPTLPQYIQIPKLQMQGIGRKAPQPSIGMGTNIDGRSVITTFFDPCFCLLIHTMASSTIDWMPSHGRHQINIGPSLGRAIKTRKLKGSPTPTTKRSNLPERDFSAFRCRWILSEILALEVAHVLS